MIAVGKWLKAKSCDEQKEKNHLDENLSFKLAK